VSTSNVKQSPFKFLDPYEKNDKDIFFGRDTEIELLYETTFKTNLLLIYGQSGTGKTSLIQCGLANRFRESDWFDIYIRRGDNINASLRREIGNKAETPIEQGASVAEGIQSLYLDFLKPVYLIFDQFEELFILGSEGERREFFETIKQLLDTLGRDGHKRGGSPRDGSPGIGPCKILFIMREEYIARLYDFEKVVPQLFNHRFRVEPMLPSEVDTVIGGSCDAFGIGFVDRERTVKGIFENNRDEQGIIRLPYLQVYLDRLHREAEKHTEVGEEKGGILFTPDLVEGIGKISDVMATFLDEQTEGVQKELEKKYPDAPDECVWQVLNCFVTVEGTNLPLEKEVLHGRLQVRKDIINDCLASLEGSRILRLSEIQKTYEIAHDALALRIDDKRSVEEKTLLKVERLVKDRFVAYGDTAAFLAKGELNYIEPYEEKLKSRLAAEEIDFIVKSRRRASKRRRNIVIGTVGIIVVLLFFAIFAGWQLQIAKEKTKEAIVNKEFAEEQKSIAEEKQKEANARRLAVIADAVVKDNPTLALRIAEKAWRLHKNPAVNDTFYKIYRENSFYKIIVKYDNILSSMAFSSDGKTVLTGSYDNTARLWNLQGNTVQEFRWHNGWVYDVAFSPDGKTILTGSKDRTARLWDRQGNTVQEFKGHTDAVHLLAFSPDGKTILTGSWDNTARLWDLRGKTVQKFKGHKNFISSVAFSPDGKTILTGSWDNTARLWDLQGNKVQEFKGHTENVSSVAFSPDGKTILTGSWDNAARLWDLQGNKVQEFKGHTENVSSVAFSPDGKTILTGSKDKTALLWDLQGNTVQEFKGCTEEVFYVAFSLYGKTILIGSNDSTARLWDLQGNMVQEFKNHTDDLSSVAFSPDGKTILTGSWDNTARLWDLQGNTVQEFKGHSGRVTSVAFSPDGKTILTGSEDNTARLWDLQGNTVQEFKGHKWHVTSVAFSPDGKTILIGSNDSTARLWDLQGNKVQEFKEHKWGVTSVAFSPDGKTILTGSIAGTSLLWDLQGNKVQVFSGHTIYVSSMAFSPDGKTVLTGSYDNTARLWDLQGNTVQEFKGHKLSVSSVAFSPDGKTILTGSMDKTARLWDLQGNAIQEFKGHKLSVSSVAFSPDGKTILTGSSDNTARLWEVAIPLEEFLKKGNLEPLTEEQKKEYGIEN
jgi:WD40 repeat protein